MSRNHYSVLLLLLFAIGIWMFPRQANTIQAQPRITNTTVHVVIPTTAPTEPPQSLNNAAINASPSPTFTPTEPLPDVRLVSIAPSGTARVIDFPENGALLGVLADNTEYQVLGQYISWYQIQFASGSNGRGWVYYLDISLSGNLDEIQYIDPNAQPVGFSPEQLASQTAQVLFGTPGVAETATAESRILDISLESNDQVESISQFAPTYTRPAEVVELRATNLPNVQLTAPAQLDLLDTTIESLAEGNMPPIVPIIALAIFGALGLLIALVRR